MPKRVLICGCGYVGLAVGARLSALGHEVFGVRRSAADSLLVAAGITLLRADLARPDDVRSLPGPYEWIVNVTSSAQGGETAYRSAYLEGTRNLIQVFGSSSCRLVYTSSTSVYAQTEGEWVTEDSDANPSTATGQILRQTEAELLGAASNCFHPTVLRVAGIYGPGRHHLLSRLLAGNRSAGAPDRWLNMVHRDDVAGAILHALNADFSGGLFNVTDNEPVQAKTFEAWLARRLNLDLDALASDANGPAKRGESNKRISNRRFFEKFGWRPSYPSYREGYGAILQELR